MSKQRGDVNHAKELFDKLARENEERNAHNAFSTNWSQIRANPANKLNKTDPGYGVPVNEKTYRRGVEANELIQSEIHELCQIIRENGRQSSDSLVEIEFKLLFAIYTNISNKLVGLLLRARKAGHVQFDGELLLQGRDDSKIIKLLD